MKILHLINSLTTGGAEKLLLESFPIYNQKEKVDLLVLNGTKHPFYQRLEEKKCCSIFDFGNINIYNPLLVFKILRYLREYDIIHAHLFPSLYWLAIAKAISFSNTKIVYTEHSTNNRRRGKLIFKILDKVIYRFYSKIITIANEVDINLKNHLGFANSKFQLINNGINTSIYQEALEHPKTSFFSKNDIILIQVASFRPPKDQETLIKALKILPDNYKLLLVGEGKLLLKSKVLANQNDLSNRIQFLGVRMDVPRLLKTADIVVLSSNHEGLSLSSIEGMASGKPFIASDVSGLREIVKGYGILFSKGDEKELARKILKVSSDKKYYNEVSIKGIQRSLQFDIKNMVDAYIKLYKEILNK